jgi:hypothetical protein
MSAYPYGLEHFLFVYTVPVINYSFRSRDSNAGDSFWVGTGTSASQRESYWSRYGYGHDYLLFFSTFKIQTFFRPKLGKGSLRIFYLRRKNIPIYHFIMGINTGLTFNL